MVFPVLLLSLVTGAGATSPEMNEVSPSSVEGRILMSHLLHASTHIHDQEVFVFAMGVALRLAQYVPALAFCVSCARAGTVLSWTMMIFAEHRDDDYLFCERYHTTSTTCTT